MIHEPRELMTNLIPSSPSSDTDAADKIDGIDNAPPTRLGRRNQGLCAHSLQLHALPLHAAPTGRSMSDVRNGKQKTTKN